MPSSACDGAYRRLHSFPTRRSSDLCSGVSARVWQGFTSGMTICRRQRPIWMTSGMLVPDGTFLRVNLPSAPLRMLTSGEPEMADSQRSEEHTSELQSLRHLVCRLLLATAPTAVFTLSLHDALPISARG